MKYFVALCVFASSVFISVSGVNAAPARCQQAVRINYMLFDESVQTYSSSRMRDALVYCRIKDWISEMRLYVSPYRNLTDYDYYRETASALKNDNLDEVRRWMCRNAKRYRAEGQYNWQKVFIGCGEKP